MGPARSLGAAVRSACARNQRRRLRGLRDRYVLWRGRQWMVTVVNPGRGVVELMPVADPSTRRKLAVDDFLSSGFRTIERPAGFRLAKAVPAADRAWAVVAGPMEPEDKIRALRDLASQVTDEGDIEIIDTYVAAIRRGERPERIRAGGE